MEENTVLNDILAKINKSFETQFETLNVDDSPLDVLTINNMPAHLDTLLRGHKIHNPLKDLPLWAKIWPASFVLGRFLRKYDTTGKTLLELGAGMGICGLIAARHGFDQITITDCAEDALDFARANVLRNNLQDIVKVAYLDLLKANDNVGSFDFIAASEILYLEDLHRPIIKFILKHLQKNGKAFFCTDLSRVKSKFKKRASEYFNIQDGNIGVRSTGEDGEEQRRIYNILILEKK